MFRIIGRQAHGGPAEFRVATEHAVSGSGNIVRIGSSRLQFQENATLPHRQRVRGGKAGSSPPVACLLLRCSLSKVHTHCWVAVQGADLTFASVGANGQLMQTSKDKKNSLRVHGHAATRAAAWKLSGNVLVNTATGTELPLTPKLLHSFSVDEMRELERHYTRSEREQSAKVCFSV